jgi:hypothetical protein
MPIPFLSQGLAEDREAVDAGLTNAAADEAAGAIARALPAGAGQRR